MPINKKQSNLLKNIQIALKYQILKGKTTCAYCTNAMHTCRVLCKSKRKNGGFNGNNVSVSHLLIHQHNYKTINITGFFKERQKGGANSFAGITVTAYSGFYTGYLPF